MTMGKKIAAYQAEDGKIFTGVDARQEMELHERILEATKEIDKTVEYARKIFDVPEATNSTPATELLDDDDETTKKEYFFMDKVVGYDDFSFDDMITWIVKMKAFNQDAFALLYNHIMFGKLSVRQRRL